MNLTQQFVLVSILPATFVLLALYSLRVPPNRRRTAYRWQLILLTGGVWTSSILSYFGGATMPVAVSFTWRIIGNYALSLLMVWLLLTTITRLNVSGRGVRLWMVISAVFWLAGLALDPAVWSYELADFPLTFLGPDTALRHFDLWGITWVLSWLIPGAVAWFLTQYQSRNAPSPIYRDQNHYWLLTVSLFIVGSGLGLTRQLVWQQFGALLTIFAAAIGTFSLTRRQLPDVQLATRQVMSRLLGALIIFGLTWLALWYISQAALTTTTSLDLAFPAAILATLFVVAFYVVNRGLQRLLLPGLGRRSTDLRLRDEMGSRLLAPVKLADLTLKLVHLHLGTSDGWLVTLEDGPGGKVLLRPLALLQETRFISTVLDADNLLIEHLRQHPIPLMQYDLDSLSVFDELAPSDRKLIHQWQRVLFMPLHAGDRLVGLIGLGPKYSGEPYENQDFLLLQELATQISPILLQSLNIHTLYHINDYVFNEIKTLKLQNQHLHELNTFYDDFLSLVSPELREPFMAMEQALQALQTALADSPDKNKLAVLERESSRLKEMLNTLINSVGRVQKQKSFDFEVIHLDEVAREAVANLAAMAEARRVTIEVEAIGNLRPVYADAGRLREAVQYMLHNAIKFNKIGGLVRMECQIQGNEICLDVIDNGVGLPEERLKHVWNGFTSLDPRSSKSAKSIGMGLPLAQFIIKAHGGRVEAISKHGAGSTFSIYLPIVLEETV